MIIVHIACIRNNPFSGVSVVVPEYITRQSQDNQVALINIRDENINGIEHQYIYKEYRSVSTLPSPFNNPDIVVFQECYRKEYLRIAYELHKKGIPYVIVPHGELGKEAQEKKRLKKVIANLTIFRSFIDNASSIQCLSQKELAETKFGKKKFIATNGVNIPRKEKKIFSKNEVKFVYIGRLDAYHKGLDMLIFAISNIADKLRKKKCSFDIYGPDREGRADYLNKLIKDSQINDLVVWKGAVTGSKKEEVLLNSDIFIQTSRFEGMPLGILEALSYGIPCLITEGTNLTKLVDKYNGGWICSNSVKEISNIILNACNEREKWRIYGENGRNLVTKEFDWDNITKRTIEQYKIIINNKKQMINNSRIHIYDQKRLLGHDCELKNGL